MKFEVIKTVGLPANTLGQGLSALFIGSVVEGSRIAEFQDRLMEMEAIRPAIDQSIAENILTEPNVDGNPTEPAKTQAKTVPVGQTQATPQSKGISVVGNEPSLDWSVADLREALINRGGTIEQHMSRQKLFDAIKAIDNGQTQPKADDENGNGSDSDIVVDDDEITGVTQ